MRLPNVFTAWADIFLGFLFTHYGAALSEPETLRQFLVLLGASSLLYIAGMILNDVFDVLQDEQERPERPIPSGRISRAWASMLGFTLLFAGVALGWVASALANDLRPGMVATILGAVVYGYDALFKKTPLGPVAMGSCRLLNVLLGMSVGMAWEVSHGLIAGGLGMYIAGVTWFGRKEAGQSSSLQLGLATAVMLGGIGLMAWFPSWAAESAALVSAPRYLQGLFWYVLVAFFGVMILRRALVAVFDPAPAYVQAAVKHCLLTYVMLTACVVLAVRGGYWAVAVVALLIPTVLLGRWVYST